MQSVTSNGVANAISKIPPNYAQKELIFNGNTSYSANYTALSNGYIMGRGYGSGQTTSYTYFTVNGVKVGQQGNSDEVISEQIPVRKGDIVNMQIYLSLRNEGIYFVPCN